MFHLIPVEILHFIWQFLSLADLASLAQCSKEDLSLFRAYIAYHKAKKVTTYRLRDQDYRAMFTFLGVRHGYYCKVHRDPTDFDYAIQRVRCGNYKLGRRVGTWRTLKPEKLIDKYQSYKHGHRHGTSTTLRFFVVEDRWGPISKDRHVRGQLHGLQRSYCTDCGELVRRVSYVHGAKHGTSLKYFHNGLIKRETEYVYGRRHGLRRTYDPGPWSGVVLQTEMSYYCGDLHGSCVEYYPNGSLKKVMTYHKGKPHGQQVFYDTKGVITKGCLWDSGVVIEEQGWFGGVTEYVAKLSLKLGLEVLHLPKTNDWIWWPNTSGSRFYDDDNVATGASRLKYVWTLPFSVCYWVSEYANKLRFRVRLSNSPSFLQTTELTCSRNELFRAIDTEGCQADLTVAFHLPMILTNHVYYENPRALKSVTRRRETDYLRLEFDRCQKCQRKSYYDLTGRLVQDMHTTIGEI